MNQNNTVMKGQYTSFGGADMTCVIGNQIVGSLQAISYSVSREKGPVYVMKGTPNPQAVARGKRAIAGTLVFLTIDEQAFLGHMEKVQGNKFYGNKADIRYSFHETDLKDKNNLFALFEDTAEITYDGPGSERAEAFAQFADQILPFDVNISASNEYGLSGMKKSFVGVEVMNEGGGVSIDDLVIEEQYTYIALGMTKWTKIRK